MNRFSEQRTVQNPLIKYATEIGWNYLPPEEALSLRGGEDGTLFAKVLAEKLIEFNKGLVAADIAQEIIRRIESVRSNIEGNAEILSWMRGEQSVYDEQEKRRRNVKVIDFENPKKNVFHVTDEWRYANARETNRADIMFLINGIPAAIVETKSAQKPEGIEEALLQIREYHRETPEMLTAPQVFDITHLIDFYYGATWNLERKNVFNWKDSSQPREGRDYTAMREGCYEKKIKQFFDQENFLQMIEKWILFYIKDDELQKTILRQHQTRAILKIIRRCADKNKKTGLIWHTQGAGKTFTMIKAACRILQNKDVFGKATIILMIDRNELEGQLSGWVTSVLREMKSHDIAVEQAASKKQLRELLVSDFRGLIVSMIHKFEGIPKDICPRANVIVMIDEAHRSVGGDLGNYLMAALPNAKLIGFTGTPIDKTAYGKGTFKIFGKEDEQGYLDKYSIIESIGDGTTLPLNYALAPNEIRVPHAQLEKEFLGLAEAEGISDIDELNRILDHAVKLKAFLKSKERLQKAAEFVAGHFKNNVEPLGYKAFLVAVDREACALYKEALDQLLPPEWVVPVYTPAQHDSEKYPLVYKHQVSADDEKNMRKLFVKPDKLPKIFIVTDKLLTGFDAPILYCIYLDKPMRDHVLLQAIARVNRPREEEGGIKKPCGLVIDFVGIFEKLEKALAFDSDEVASVIKNLDLILARFITLMKDPGRQYLALVKGKADDKTVERAIDAFADKKEREAFYAFFKEIETLYEILSPSPELRDYMADFGNLSILYQIVRNAFQKRTGLYMDAAKKTEMLVRENVAAYGLKTTLPEVKIDENTVRAVKESHSSDNVRIINLVNSINRLVMKDGDDKPYLRPIGERAAQIQEAFDGRQLSTMEALRNIEGLIGEIIKAGQEQKETGFDINTFSIYWVLQERKLKDAIIIAPIANNIFVRFPNYNHNAEELRQIKADLYKLFMPLVGKTEMVPLVENLLKLNRT
jgi:type I restriction enzyme R subunit